MTEMEKTDSIRANFKGPLGRNPINDVIQPFF